MESVWATNWILKSVMRVLYKSVAAATRPFGITRVTQVLYKTYTSNIPDRRVGFVGERMYCAVHDC